MREIAPGGIRAPILFARGNDHGNLADEIHVVTSDLLREWVPSEIPRA